MELCKTNLNSFFFSTIRFECISYHMFHHYLQYKNQNNVDINGTLKVHQQKRIVWNYPLIINFEPLSPFKIQAVPQLSSQNTTMLRSSQDNNIKNPRILQDDTQKRWLLSLKFTFSVLKSAKLAIITHFLMLVLYYDVDFLSLFTLGRDRDTWS